MEYKWQDEEEIPQTTWDRRHTGKHLTCQEHWPVTFPHLYGQTSDKKQSEQGRFTVVIVSEDTACYDGEGAVTAMAHGGSWDLSGRLQHRRTQKREKLKQVSCNSQSSTSPGTLLLPARPPSPKASTTSQNSAPIWETCVQTHEPIGEILLSNLDTCYQYRW